MGLPRQLLDRYKSLQRRELIEPRDAPQKFVRRGKRLIEYEPGSRGERENDMHAETTKARMAERNLGKALL